MENAEPGYTIGVVARRTNIHPETLRVWERRYQMVVPQRNLTGRRLYSEDDILKLSPCATG
jgi:DNA-binding transcriptional MerR regulator